MNQTIINNHNSLIPNSNDNVTVHLGDFALAPLQYVIKIIKQLNGLHIFLKGSHDKWINELYHKPYLFDSIKYKFHNLNNFHELQEFHINNIVIVCCHYMMYSWPKSHYGSFQLFGHHHARLNGKEIGKQHDVGVDNNNFFPFPDNKIIEIMKNKPDNPFLLTNKYEK